jgi:hypothetical protein
VYGYGLAAPAALFFAIVRPLKKLRAILTHNHRHSIGDDRGLNIGIKPFSEFASFSFYHASTDF